MSDTNPPAPAVDKPIGDPSVVITIKPDRRKVGYGIIDKAQKAFTELRINEAEYARWMAKGWAEVADFHVAEVVIS